jgi:MFS family permease
MNQPSSSAEQPSRWSTTLLPLTAGLAAFCTYSCMYAFRKPFSAGSYEGMRWLGIDYKVWLVIAQVLGYAVSKLWGIRLVPELQTSRRAVTILALIGLSWLALLGFALTPPLLGIVFLFLNGLPLGMVWGLVFGYIEGRRATELMGAILASSFIFASGMVKGVGKAMLLAGVSEHWMPFLTGLVFVPPLLLSLHVLTRVPPPNAEDIAARAPRGRMDHEARKQFVRRFLPGLLLIVPLYVLLTVLRDFRENFDTEIFRDLGFGRSAVVFGEVDTPIGIGVLMLTAALTLVHDNMRALMLNHVLIGAGLCCAGLSTLLFAHGELPPLLWMTLVGFGLYLAYIPLNCMFFERLMATFRIAGTASFVMYIADASGYMGSVAVLLIKQFLALQINWTQFFERAVLASSLIGLVLITLAARWFWLHGRQNGHAMAPLSHPRMESSRL